MGRITKEKRKGTAPPTDKGHAPLFLLTYLPPTQTAMAAATAIRTNTMTNAATTSPTDHGSIIRTLPNAATTSMGPTPWRIPGDAANSFDSAAIFYGTESSRMTIVLVVLYTTMGPTAYWTLG